VLAEKGVFMKETFKSLVFVIVTVMIALVLQAQAGGLNPEDSPSADETPTEQLRTYN
jgi:hypothetical protein